MTDTSETYTGPEVARQLHLSEDRVRRLAIALHVGRKHGRDWLFSAADVAAMRARNTQRGRPPMVPSDAEWWRAATAHEIVNALGVLRNANRMSPVEYKREQERAYNMRAAHDDAALMEMLRQYAPDDPHVNNYPG